MRCMRVDFGAQSLYITSTDGMSSTRHRDIGMSSHNLDISIDIDKDPEVNLLA